jgi:hypothetical protein
MGDGEKAENLADDLDVAGVVDIKPTKSLVVSLTFPLSSNVARMNPGPEFDVESVPVIVKAIQASESAKCTGRAVCFSSPLAKSSAISSPRTAAEIGRNLLLSISRPE